MKNIYLIYNGITNTYTFGSGPNSQSLNEREEWVNLDYSGLRGKLKTSIDTKRKSLLFLINVPKDIKIRIEGFFEKTSISVVMGRK